MRAALTASFGNAERAVEFLTNPELMQAAVARQTAMAAPAAATGAGGASGAAPADPLEAFRRSPEFGAVRQMLAQNPTAMQQVLETMRTQNPALFQAVSQSRENMTRFVEMLAGDDGDDADGVNPFGDDTAAPGGGGAGTPSVTLHCFELDELGGFPGGGSRASPEQLIQAMQHIRNLPPEQRNALLQQFVFSLLSIFALSFL